MDTQQFRAWCQSPSHARDPLVMGILNLTPDSFYDGGRYTDSDAAYIAVENMIAAGADIIDIGGESSRPGAKPVALQEELDRVLPIIARIRAAHPIALSIDTYKPEVMRSAVLAGASCINDIFALQMPGALATALTSDVPICLMHMQGSPDSMQNAPCYPGDVVEDVNDFFVQRLQACTAIGIDRRLLILDPGFGFGKTTDHNLCLVKRAGEFRRHGLPIMLGVSRKSTLGHLLGQPPEGSLVGGLALGVYALLAGVAIIRTHDVLETKQACQVIQHLQRADRGQ